MVFFGVYLIGGLPWASAQGPAIITHELCWTTPANVDSSILAYHIYSGRADEPLVVNYLDATGNSVTVTGGTLKVGKCCCETAAAIGADRANAMHLTPMCLDGTQSLNRIILSSSSTAVPVLIAYIDQNGQRFAVEQPSGLSYGYCGCCLN